MSVSTFAICGAFALLVLIIFILTPHEGHYDFQCPTCGCGYDADEVEIYQASDASGLFVEFYDACDCPNCGRQLIIGRRLEEIE